MYWGVCAVVALQTERGRTYAHFHKSCHLQRQQKIITNKGQQEKKLKYIRNERIDTNDLIWLVSFGRFN